MRNPALLVLAVLSPLIAAAEPNLIGTWKSNKQLTLQSISIDPSVEEEAKEKIGNLFGRMTVTYSKNRAVARMEADQGIEEWESASSYKIVASTKDRVTIKWKDQATGEETTTVMHFTGPDRYWIQLPSSDIMRGKEFFDRVKEPTPAASGNAGSAPGH